MEKIDTKKLFQITEAAHACGLSRSTLMRLEEKGLLKPAYIAPDSGRRYYDNHNVARILQIEKFKAMGFGTEEIAGYFVRGGEAEGLLAVLEERLHSLQRSVEEMRLRATESDQFSVQMVTLPAATCCIQWHVGHTFAERYDAMYDFYSQCIREGCVLSDEPAGLSGGIHRRHALSLRGLRSGAAGESACRGGDAAGVPGAVGAVLRRLQQCGRGVAAAGM